MMITGISLDDYLFLKLGLCKKHNCNCQNNTNCHPWTVFVQCACLMHPFANMCLLVLDVCPRWWGKHRPHFSHKLFVSTNSSQKSQWPSNHYKWTHPTFPTESNQFSLTSLPSRHSHFCALVPVLRVWLLGLFLCWGEILDSMMHLGDRRGWRGPFFRLKSISFQKNLFIILCYYPRVQQMYFNSKYEICKCSYFCWKFVAVIMQLDKMNENLLQTPTRKDEVIDHI